jgi:hypothetical protein
MLNQNFPVPYLSVVTKNVLFTAANKKASALYLTTNLSSGERRTAWCLVTFSVN